MSCRLCGGSCEEVYMALNGAEHAPIVHHHGRVEIDDVSLQIPGSKASSRAWVVHPAGKAERSSRPGIIFLHWLGGLNSGRGEFLAEAVSFARQGAVSILPEGLFPYTGSGPDGSSSDVAAVQMQLEAFRGALEALAQRCDVDQHRIALVGHDYGAMYGALIAAEDRRIAAAVLAAPDAT
jgi:dienelactone hydrolase